MTSARFGFGFCSLVGAIVSGGLLLAADSPPGSAKHEAVAYLQIRPELGGDAAAAKARWNTQVALLKSPLIVGAALRLPGIADLKTIQAQDNPAAWLSGSIAVVPDDSGVVQVRLRGEDPVEIAKILDAVMTAYLQEVVQKDRGARLARRDSLEKKFKETQADLRKQKEEFYALERTTEHHDDLEIGWLEGDLVGLRSELTGVRTALRAVEADITVAAAVGEPADAKLEARRKVLVEQAAALATQIEAVRSRLRDLKKAADLAVRRAEVNRTERVVGQIGRQLEESNVDLSMPSSVRLLEDAIVLPVAPGK